MKVSEMIKHLEMIREQVGDIDMSTDAKIITRRQDRVQAYLNKLLVRKVKYEAGAYDQGYEKCQQERWTTYLFEHEWAKEQGFEWANKDPMEDYDEYHKGVRCVPNEEMFGVSGSGFAYTKTDIPCEKWEQLKDMDYCELLAQIYKQEIKLANAKRLDANETAKLAKHKVVV